MKHHYAEWTTGNEGLGGFAKLAIAPTDMHTSCTRCGTKVKQGVGQSIRFWVNGKWVAKRPTCTGPNRTTPVSNTSSNEFGEAD